MRGEAMPSSAPGSPVIVDKFSFFLKENVLFSFAFFSPSIFSGKCGQIIKTISNCSCGKYNFITIIILF